MVTAGQGAGTEYAEEANFIAQRAALTPDKITGRVLSKENLPDHETARAICRAAWKTASTQVGYTLDGAPLSTTAENHLLTTLYARLGDGMKLGVIAVPGEEQGGVAGLYTLNPVWTSTITPHAARLTPSIDFTAVGHQIDNLHIAPEQAGRNISGLAATLGATQAKKMPGMILRFNQLHGLSLPGACADIETRAEDVFHIPRHKLSRLPSASDLTLDGRLNYELIPAVEYKNNFDPPSWKAYTEEMVDGKMKRVEKLTPDSSVMTHLNVKEEGAETRDVLHPERKLNKSLQNVSDSDLKNCYRLVVRNGTQMVGTALVSYRPGMDIGPRIKGKTVDVQVERMRTMLPTPHEKSHQYISGQAITSLMLAAARDGAVEKCGAQCGSMDLAASLGQWPHVDGLCETLCAMGAGTIIENGTGAPVPMILRPEMRQYLTLGSQTEALATVGSTISPDISHIAHTDHPTTEQGAGQEAWRKALERGPSSLIPQTTPDQRITTMADRTSGNHRGGAHFRF